jgi:thioredoxin reductase (NADPH)
MHEFDVVIVGAGVAGLTAAVHAGRRGLRVAAIDRMGVGGQISGAERIENFPGMPQGIGGVELGPLLHEQAEAAGAEFLLDEAEAFDTDGKVHAVRCSGETVAGRALIVAAGSSLRTLGIPGEQQFLGRGVSHCASCDAQFFAGQEVCVVGGGDSALDEAMVLAEHAAKVIVVHRGPSLDAQQVLVARASANRKIEFVFDTEVTEILGTEFVSAVRLRDRRTGATGERPLKGVLAYVGLEPNTAFLGGRLALDPAGHIETDIMMRTSLAGVFAAGDIRRHSVAQLAAAAGDGATAAIAAFRYLNGAG